MRGAVIAMEKKNRASSLVAFFLFVLLWVVIGYVLSAIIYTKGTATISEIIYNPKLYANSLTPVVILICEVAFGGLSMSLLMKRNETTEEEPTETVQYVPPVEESEPVVTETVEEPDTEEEDEQAEIEAFYEKYGIVKPSEEEPIEVKKEEVEEKEEEPFVAEEVKEEPAPEPVSNAFTELTPELIAAGYTAEQIEALSTLSMFYDEMTIDDVTDAFNTDMTAEEIYKFIEEMFS